MAGSWADNERPMTYGQLALAALVSVMLAALAGWALSAQQPPSDAAERLETCAPHVLEEWQCVD